MAPTAGQVDHSVNSAVKYILSQIGTDGLVKNEYPQEDSRYGSKTLLAVYALVAAEVDWRKTPELQRALKWALDAELRGTAAVAYRTLALAAMKDDRAARRLAEDVLWLVKAANSAGGYTYTSAGGKQTDTYDNTNGYLAVLAVAAASERGTSVPPAYWKLIAGHWRDDQQPDGGWGYRTHIRGGQRRVNSYGAMTAAGLTAMSICFDRLNRQRFTRCEAAAQPAACLNAMKWLEQHFSVRGNPRKGVEYYHFWLYCLQQVGRNTGRKYLSGVDWYAAGAGQLLAKQHDDGSWGFGDRIEQCSFALLFLAHGRAPIVLSKVSYPGRWNPRPQDAANLVGWLGYQYEKQLGWQVIDIDSVGDEADDGRIVYISGAGTINLTDKQIVQLRRFVQRGGLILSEAACDNDNFTLNMHKFYRIIFPQYRLVRLAKDHPIYRLQFRQTAPSGLMGVSNGVRLLAVHAPQQLSLSLQLGPAETRRPVFNLLANLYLYLTDKRAGAPRGLATWPSPTRLPGKARTTIRVARVKYAGNYDPEPLALQRLGEELIRRYNTALDTTAVPVEKLSAKDRPIALMTGTGNFKLAGKQITAIRQYLADGGTLVIDAAGGSDAFNKSASALLGQLGKVSLLRRDSPIYLAGPNRIVKVRYRHTPAAAEPPKEKNLPRLQAIYIKDRPAVIYSPEDLTAGLVGYPLDGLSGYRPADARKIMVNILMVSQDKSRHKR